jgi:hypothetical protein
MSRQARAIMAPMKLTEFVPFERPLEQPAGSPDSDGAVNHLCACLREAWRRQHRDSLEIGRNDGDPHVEDFAARVLDGVDLAAAHVGVAKAAGTWSAYVFHRAGIDLFRIMLDAREGTTYLRGLERRFRAPGWLDYRESLVDFRPEFEVELRTQRRYALPNADDRYGYIVSVNGPGLDEPVELHVKPDDVEAFIPLRDLLRECARRPKPVAAPAVGEA